MAAAVEVTATVESTAVMSSVEAAVMPADVTAVMSVIVVMTGVATPDVDRDHHFAR